MIKIVLLVILTASCQQAAAVSLTTSFTDGPYLFWEQEQPVAYYVKNEIVCKETLKTAADGKFYLYWAEDKAEPVKIIAEFPPWQTSYSLPSKFLALSDLHGNLDGTVELLRAGGVIDLNYNWSYGGWLIINGDIFDRGEDVTKILWLFYHLWQQAELSGNGKVILLLGNHETMTLSDKTRETEEKYTLTCQLLDKTYNELYGNNSFLGHWLRSWQTVLILDQFLFVHGGISPGLAARYPDPEMINTIIFEHYSGKPVNNDELNYIFSNNGPFWYRGYFYQDDKWEMADPEIIKQILDTYSLEKIIVGHTTSARIKTFQNNQVIAVDAGLKYQKSGEALLFQNNKFFVLASSGRISELNSE